MQLCRLHRCQPSGTHGAQRPAETNDLFPCPPLQLALKSEGGRHLPGESPPSHTWSPALYQAAGPILPGGVGSPPAVNQLGLDCQHPTAGASLGGPPPCTHSPLQSQQRRDPRAQSQPRGARSCFLALLPGIEKADKLPVLRQGKSALSKVNQKRRKIPSCKPAFENQLPLACPSFSAWATKWPGHVSGGEELTGAKFINKPSLLFY